MTTLRIVLAGLLAALGLVVLTPVASQACSCAVAGVPAYVEWADTVFTGTLVEVRQPPEAEVVSSADPVTYVFEVDEAYEGDVAATAEVTSARYGASCGLEGLRVGTSYVVFADDAADGLTTTSCSGTGPARPHLVDRVERMLGPGDAPPGAGPALTAPARVAIAGLLALLGWG